MSTSKQTCVDVLNDLSSILSLEGVSGPQRQAIAQAIAVIAKLEGMKVLSTGVDLGSEMQNLVARKAMGEMQLIRQFKKFGKVAGLSGFSYKGQQDGVEFVIESTEKSWQFFRQGYELAFQS